MLKQKLIIHFFIILIIIPIFFINCNFFTSGEAPVIDSIYVIETDNIYIGDTLHVVCSAQDPQHESLEYQWTCTNGTIEGDDSTAVFISENNSIATITCSVSNEYGSNTKDHTIQAQAPVINNYFPIETGNSWTFDSHRKEIPFYGYDSTPIHHFRGEEIWEIVNYASRTLTVEIQFNGLNYVETYYHISGESTFTYGDSINWNMTVNLNQRDSTWYFDSYKTGNNTPPCLYLVKKFGIPSGFNSDDDIVTRGRKGYNSIFWLFEKDVGPKEGAFKDSDGMTWDLSYSVDLLSYSLNN